MELTKEYFDEMIKTLATSQELKKIEEKVDAVQETVKEIKKDTDAYATDIVNHDNRIKRVEKQLRLKLSS